MGKAHVDTIEAAYREVTMGHDEPDMMIGPAGIMRGLGLRIPKVIGDDVMIIVTKDGWAVYE